MPLSTNYPILRAAHLDITRRFLEAPGVYCTCNPSTMGCLLVCKFLIDPVITLEAAAREVLA